MSTALIGDGIPIEANFTHIARPFVKIVLKMYRVQKFFSWREKEREGELMLFANRF